MRQTIKYAFTIDPFLLDSLKLLSRCVLMMPYIGV